MSPAVIATRSVPPSACAGPASAPTPNRVDTASPMPVRQNPALEDRRFMQASDRSRSMRCCDAISGPSRLAWTEVPHQTRLAWDGGSRRMERLKTAHFVLKNDLFVGHPGKTHSFQDAPALLPVYLADGVRRNG